MKNDSYLEAAFERLYMLVTPLPCSLMLCNRYIEAEDGLRFLYKRQQEQQKQETRVRIIIAAAAPTIIPIKTVKL
jgi:response regulator of citrate/malate metabolism